MHKLRLVIFAKMTVATSQGRLPFKEGIYCNITMIAATTVQKPNFMVQMLYTTRYLHKFLVNQALL